MPLETGTYISDLNASNPAHVDGLNQADSHLRLLKSTIKATFPNFTAAAMTSTQAQVDALVAALGGNISLTGGKLVTTKQLTGPGTVPTGAVVDFMFPPATLGTDWLELDGSTQLYNNFPALGAIYGAAPGGSFTLHNTKDTGRFRRSRTATFPAGIQQANQNLGHTHTNTVSLESAAHAHTFSGTTSGQSADHSHLIYGPSGQIQNAGTIGGTGNIEGGLGHNSGLTSNDHNHTYSGTTSTESANHSHTVAIAIDGGSEARPESLSVVVCIKT